MKNFVKRSFVGKSLNGKIAASIIAIVWIMMLVFMGLFCYTYYGMIMERLTKDISQRTSLVADAADDWVMQYIKITDNSFSNATLNNAIKHKNDNTVSEILYNFEMQNFLQSISVAANDISDIYFEDVQGDIIGLGNVSRDYFWSELHEVRKAVGDSDVAPHFRAFSNEYMSGIIIARRIASYDDYYKYTVNGIMYVLVNTEGFGQKYIKYFSNGSEKTFLTDANNNILISDNDNYKSNEQLMLPADLNEKTISLGGEKSYFFVSNLEKSNLKFVTTVSCRDFNAPIQSMIFNVFVILLILSVIISFVAKKVAESIAEPIRKIAVVMDNARADRYMGKLSEPMDEVLMPIVKSYNSMIDELDVLINKELAYQIKVKEATLKAFEQQINPHFLYNTLNMIRVMSSYGETDKIDVILTELGNMMKYCNNRNHSVKVSDEINNIKAYLKIIKIRFGDDFDYKVDTDTNAVECQTIKFILQPFIENAVKHGVSKSEDTGMIDISVKSDNGRLTYIISDNGTGIPTDRLRQIKNNLNSSDMYNADKNLGIGILNVYMRGKLNYGDDFRLEIYSTVNKGTRVEIGHPIVPFEKNENRGGIL